MLHRMVAVAWMWAALGVSQATAAPTRDALPFEPVSAEARATLLRRARAATVRVRRSGGPTGRVRVVGANTVEGRGWWAGEGRVVTAWVLVDGWPRSETDVIEVVDEVGRVHAAAVGVSEAALGLVVLDVPGLGAPDQAATPDKGEGSAEDDAEATVAEGRVAPGRSLFAADGAMPLQRVVIGAPGTGELAYYWQLDGFLAPGTPLFDGRGRLATMVGRAVGPSEALALPVKALAALLERDDWR